MSRPYKRPFNPRGTYNYRSNVRQRYVPQGRDVSKPDNTVFLRGLGDLALQGISIPPAPQDNDGLDISETKYLGSYNWADRTTPTILVPGSPSRWLEKGPFRVDPDVGTIITDHNAYHMKEGALIPLFVAVDANEDADAFDWPAVDIVTDRNAFRKLLRWIDGDDKNAFRIDLQLVGKKTLLMTRWANEVTEPFRGYTYGLHYFNESTKKPHRESTGHHRIISYNWNGLNVVLRSTVDAFIPTSNSTNVDDIVDIFSSLDISQQTSSSAEQVKNLPLEVVHFGAKVPQESIVKIATISKTRESQLDWKEKGPQLFFSQISHFYVGLHDRGFFSEVRKHDFHYSTLPDQILQNMKKLRHALRSIQELALEKGQRGRLSLVCIDGVLKVYERLSDKSCLPDELLERFGH
ncbi:hypothetical protein APHAL10511_002623 [Amanita phalloides]|nr:hypothetical protein APHAL10511_002623 [Amanita phalloides]